MRKSLFLLSFLFFNPLLSGEALSQRGQAMAFSSQSAFAKEGGMDGGHSGGGGTFVQSESSRGLVFWDLFLQNPQIRDDEAGDKITFDIPGFESVGFKAQWKDFSRFQAYRFLQQRLDLWKRRAPLLVRAVRKNEKERFRLLIATSLSIQSILEIHIPERAKAHRGFAVPGAYFEAATNRIYLDVKVWNKAGRQSQAAMLLHERLREMQDFYGLSNELIQRIVYLVVMYSPESAEPAKYSEDFRFIRDLNLPERILPFSLPPGTSRTDPLPFAFKEAQEAIDKKILGHDDVYIPPKDLKPAEPLD